jgi:hypothetical protein
MAISEAGERTAPVRSTGMARPILTLLALGPLQAMGVAGSMTFSIVPAGPGADLTVNYAVGGYSKDGFDALSKAVDSVLGLQVARLQRLAETGSAVASTP